MSARLPFVLVLFGVVAFAPAPFPRQRRGSEDAAVSMRTMEGLWRVEAFGSTRDTGDHAKQDWHIKFIRIRDGRTEWVNVTTGLAAGTLVEVFGDLRAGDQIAARGTDELKPGMIVHAQAAKPAKS